MLTTSSAALQATLADEEGPPTSSSRTASRLPKRRVSRYPGLIDASTNLLTVASRRRRVQPMVDDKLELQPARRGALPAVLPQPARSHCLPSMMVKGRQCRPAEQAEDGCCASADTLK